MKIKLTQYTKAFFRTSRKTIGVFLLLLLTIHCTNNTEPSFNIKGDKNVLKDVKVNVEMITSDSIIISSIFNKGQKLPLNNKDALHYTIYISYKDSLFYLYKTDNLHGKIKGKPINEIVITQKDGNIIALYRTFNHSNITSGNTLLPANNFFANRAAEDIDKMKQKFTDLYKSDF